MTLGSTRIRPLPPWKARRRDIEDARRTAAILLMCALCLLMFQLGYFAATMGVLR